MKKSLSLLVAIAMVFSMFASVAFAADELTAEQKYEALVEAGIFAGFPDGEAHLDEAMTRAQAAKIIALLTGYEEGDEVEDAGFTDLAGAGWAADYINYVAGLGIVNGMGNNKFAPSAEVTTEQLAKMVVETLDIEVDEEATVDGEVSDWAVAYVAAAVKAGLLAAQEDYTVSATRELLVVASYTAYELISVPAELAVSKAVQTNKGEITVTFNKAATADEQKDLTFAVANGAVKYNVTVAWAEDGKSAILTSNYLPAATYTVTVGEFAPVQVTVANEVPTKIEIGATTLQKAAAQDLKVKLYNQFDKEISNSVLNVTVYNATYGKSVTVTSGKVDLASDSVARVDDNVVVTASHSGSGLSATKTFKVVAGSSATAITLSAPSPLKDKARISVGDQGIVLPYTLADQYGGKVTLPETTSAIAFDATTKQAHHGGLTFLVSDATIVEELQVDDKGVLTLNLGDQAGTAVITALNPATGANATITFKVEAKPVVKSLQLNDPGVIIAALEDVIIPFTAVDTFDAPIVGKDLDLSQINFNSSLSFNEAPRLNAKGELVFNFDDVPSDRTVNIFVQNKTTGALLGQVQLVVKPEAKPVKVNGLNVSKYFANDATAAFAKGDITYLDTYNRTVKVDAEAFTISTPADSAFQLVGGNTWTADEEKVGKVEVSVSLNGVTDSTFKTTVEVVKTSDVKSYAFDAVGTIYAGAYDADEFDYTKPLKLVGKLTGGQSVVIVQDDAFDFITTSNPEVIDVVAWNVIAGVDAGKATIAAYKGATKLAEVEVTASKAKPVAAKVEVKLTASKVAVNGTTTVSAVITDQYGVDITDATFAIVASSDAAIASVDGVTVTGKKLGTATITVLTTNGVSGSATLSVE